MGNYSRPRTPGYSPSGFSLTGVKWLLAANISLYFIYLLASLAQVAWVFDPFHLVPRDVLRGFLWQPVSYLFLHDPRGVFHILFNMLSL